MDDSAGVVAELSFTRANVKTYTVANEILEGNEVIGLRCSLNDTFKAKDSISNLSFVLWSGPIRHKDISEQEKIRTK